MTTPASATPTAVHAALTVSEPEIRLRVTFNAAPYLAQASVQALWDLANNGFGSSTAADKVAHWTTTAPDAPERDAHALNEAFDRLADAGVPHKYTVDIDTEQAAGFLVEHRPDALLYGIAEQVRNEDENQSPWSPSRDWRSTLGDLSSRDVHRYVASTFYELPDEAIGRTASSAADLIYRIAFTLGPDLPVAMLHGTPEAAIEQSAENADRARLYRAAGVPVDEARDLEADPALRPTDDQLRTLAALRGGRTE